MKDTFVTFYSWQESTPKKENKQKILNQLNKDVKKLKENGITIVIDQDSRDTTRENSIDTIVLEKISKCDFFIADITPAATQQNTKPIPNPNVMFELGYAVKAIGWARCILVWNLKQGDVKDAPFDIRNHSILKYHSDESISLCFYDVLKDKINRYEQILAEHKNQDVDYNTFLYWKNLASPQKINDIVSGIITTCAYEDKHFSLLDRFQYEYTKLANHFKNESLEKYRKELNDSLGTFCFYLAGSAFDRVNKNDPHCNYWKMNENYTMHDPIKENQIIKKVHDLGEDVLEKNKQYFEALQSVFGYLDKKDEE